jgi:hypothetical protein
MAVFGIATSIVQMRNSHPDLPLDDVFGKTNLPPIGIGIAGTPERF